MKLSKYILSALFAMMAGIGIVKIIMGELSPIAIFFCLGYLCMVAALNRRGGKIIKNISYFFAGILSLFLLGTVFSLGMPLFGGGFELGLFIASSLFGAVGVLTIFTIKNENAKSI